MSQQLEIKARMSTVWHVATKSILTICSLSLKWRQRNLLKSRMKRSPKHTGASQPPNITRRSPNNVAECLQ